MGAAEVTHGDNPSRRICALTPVLTAPGDTLVSFREPEIVLEASATDEDNDALTFEWEVLEEGGLSADQLSLQTQSRDGATTLRMLLPSNRGPLRHLAMNEGEMAVASGCSEAQGGGQVGRTIGGATSRRARPHLGHWCTA